MSDLREACKRAVWQLKHDELRSALRYASTGAGYAVKPLEWISCDDGSYHDAGCQYEIEPLGKFFRLSRAVTGSSGYLCDAYNVKACKETAQYDFERRIRLALASPQNDGEAVAELKPWRDELSEIIGHLGAAITQSIASDDQIIMDHVKAAHETAKIVRRKA